MKKEEIEKQLKPCPFCGHEAKFRRDLRWPFGHMVSCTKCFASFYISLADDNMAWNFLKEHWNKRDNKL